MPPAEILGPDEFLIQMDASASVTLPVDATRVALVGCYDVSWTRAGRVVSILDGSGARDGFSGPAWRGAINPSDITVWYTTRPVV